MLGLGFFGDEQAQFVLPIHPAPVTLKDDLLVGGTSNPLQPRLFMLRDSFAVALGGFLASHFSRLYGTSNQSFDPALIAQERPDLVMVEIVERRLNKPPPIDPDNALEVRDKDAPFPKVWGVIDEPANGATLTGSIHTGGWVLANQPNSIQKVEVLMDGKPVSDMKIHLPHGGVAEAQPGMKDSANAGVEWFLDSRSLSNGTHRMVWRATDTAGNTKDVAKRQFCVVN
jgi:hypothetical protein